MGDMVGKNKVGALITPLLVVVWVACANIYTARGVYHHVQPGETLNQLATRYGASLQELAEINDVENSSQLKVGQPIFIPGVRVGGGSLARRHNRPQRKFTASPGSSSRIEVHHGRFAWPIEGELSSLYGVRHGRRHDGIDIRASRGTPILAAADGEVVYSKRLRGYGNLILLKHREDFFTVYAHTSVNLVKKGARIKKGQMIAKVGSTGRSTGPHLHFEVREGTKPRNPLFFLSTNRYAERARGKDSGLALGGE